MKILSILVPLNHWKQHVCSYSLFISDLEWILEKEFVVSQIIDPILNMGFIILKEF